MTTVNGLAPAPARVLAWVRAYVEAHGHGPSLPEIAAGLDRSTGAIGIHLGTLEARGWLRRGGQKDPVRLTGKPWPGAS